MDINSLKNKITADIDAVKDLPALAEFKAEYLGKKGAVTALFEDLKNISDKEEKKEKGRQVNEVKISVETACIQKEKQFLNAKKAADLKEMDLTLPPYSMAKGSIHPLTKTMQEINSVFMRMGFVIEAGPEIEEAKYNFTMLNFPEDHPAMDMHDTFHVDEKYLLRTHTSPIQIRTMLNRKPPFKIVAPGRVYRRDAVDASHSPVFHQVEAFMVGENVRFSDLKGLLDTFAKQIFSSELKTRFRPSFFPFTEPSAEMDVTCVNCMGKGCPTCKKTGWLEILGCGMIHTNVFKAVGYDPEKNTGFALGMGVERIAMLKYGINDMRLFFENDVRFLKQF
jgi:phenylalanyl-tRNA synthetase alpha chain